MAELTTNAQKEQALWGRRWWRKRARVAADVDPVPWADALSEVPPLLELASDYPRPRGDYPLTRGGPPRYAPPADVVTYPPYAAAHVADAAGDRSTKTDALVAAWARVLAHHARADEVVLGISTGGGPFAPVRVDCEDATVASLAHRPSGSKTGLGFALSIKEDDGPRCRRGCDVDSPRRRVAAAPRRRRGYFSDESRRRRGCDVDSPWRRVATPPLL